MLYQQQLDANGHSAEEQLSYAVLFTDPQKLRALADEDIDRVTAQLRLGQGRLDTIIDELDRDIHSMQIEEAGFRERALKSPPGA